MLFDLAYKFINHLFKQIRRYSWLLVITFSLSCGNQPRSDNSNAGYNKIIDSANKIFDVGKAKEAVHYLDSATAKNEQLGLLQKFNYYNINYNYFYHKRNEKDIAMLYADSMLDLFNSPQKKIKYAQQYGQCYFFKGDLFFDENKFDEAYQYYYQGKIIANNSLNDCTLSDYSYRMGMIMYKQEHYQLAAKYFKLSSKQTNTCEWSIRSFYRRQELLNNTGLSYSKINMRDSAMAYYKKALVYINTYGAGFREKDLLDAALGVVYGNEANIYLSNGDEQSAEILLKKSIAINLRKGYDNRDAQLSELKLAHLYTQENKTDSLNMLLRQIQLQFDSIKNQDAEADWNMLMANSRLKQNDGAGAYQYLLKHDALTDSINDGTKKLKEADIFKQIERLEKNYAFVQLQQNNRSQQYYLVFAVIFGLMLVTIMFLILRNWQRSKKNLQALSLLNSQINEQNLNLEEALNKLNLSSQEKDRILRTVAHDLRNPLGGVASLAGMMVDDEDFNEEQKELINLIKETSHNSLDLINDILEATEEIADKREKEKELVELNSLLNNSVELMRFKAAEKKQQIIFDAHVFPIELEIYREQIWRVISNLISNAIKFSPEMSIISVKLSEDDQYVNISVTDDGIGIPDHLHDKIFNTFTEAKRPGTAGERSFGLGLSICRQIIEKHKGKIWFESNGKQGSVFFIALNKFNQASGSKSQDASKSLKL